VNAPNKARSDQLEGGALLQAHGLTLYEPADLSGELAPPQAPEMRKIASWAVEFLSTPNPDLGRGGSVCPYIKHSMNNNSFLLACAAGERDLRSIEASFDKYRRWFIELRDEPEREHKHLLAILVLLPDFDRTDPDPLDVLQGRLKDAFVHEGLMVGQFHPRCAQKGLWNEDFRPLRAPIPLLAIRQMVASDLPFLVGSASHLSAYLDRFAPNIPSHIRRLLVARITRATDQHGAAA
jgi:hypothetical protein